MSGYTFLWMFLVYGFAGWLVETVFVLVKTKKLVNRGFLQGPVASAYGLTMIAAFSASYPFAGTSPWIKIPLTVLFCTVGVFLFEFLSAIVFKKVFGKYLWNRSNIKFLVIKNLIYSAAAALVMIFFQPLLEEFIVSDLLANNWDKVSLILVVCILILVLDLVYSVAEMLNMSKKIASAKELEALLNKANPDKSLKVYAKTDFLGEDRAEFDKKSAKYKKFILSNNFVYKRFAKAYPKLQAEDNLKLLEDLKYMYYLLKIK